MKRDKIVQIHPTLKCNLRCAHCYSSSGPENTKNLSDELLLNLIEDVKNAGYKVIGFSGGEPLIYPHLANLLAYGISLGLKTTVTSNGILLTEKRIKKLQNNITLLAISLDGTPESHDVVRGNPKAFQIMRENLEHIRKAKIPFGFIFTLTQHNLDELPWVADFAIQQGAKLLQIHPLEEVGRASKNLKGSKPDEIETGYALLLVKQLQDYYGDTIKLQLDLTSKKMMLDQPDQFFATSLSNLESMKLSDLVSPLVIEADGTVVPVQYGFPRPFSLGNLHDARLPELFNDWRKTGLSSFYHHCRDVFDEIISNDQPLINWFEKVHQHTV